MAGKLVINTPRYRGEYELDLEAEPFTALEWRWIKRISGYLPLTLDEGWRGGDPDVVLAFAVIAMHRAGRIGKADALAAAGELEDAPVDGASITFRVDAGVEPEPEADASPPEEPATAGPPSNTGESSRSISVDPRANGPSSTGTRESPRSATSDPATSRI